MKTIERFFVGIYKKSCSASAINEARHQLFTSGSRNLEALPTTQAALFEHIKQAILQACFIWKQSGQCQQNISDFANWGWTFNKQNNKWVPFWASLPDASSACQLLLHCGCMVACQGNCKCYKARMHCTSLCKCDGGCLNNRE